jgi:hypothetical protein
VTTDSIINACAGVNTYQIQIYHDLAKRLDRLSRRNFPRVTPTIVTGPRTPAYHRLRTNT